MSLNSHPGEESRPVIHLQSVDAELVEFIEHVREVAHANQESARRSGYRRSEALYQGKVLACDEILEWIKSNEDD